MNRNSKIRAAHTRSKTTVLKGFLSRKNAVAVFHMFRTCDRPFDFLKRYLARGGGTFPDQYRIKTPIGKILVQVFTPDDILTINEIFFRNDYPVDDDMRVFVDFGSNIGISTLYWLSRNRNNFAYCYEPLPENIKKFSLQLQGFEGRFEFNGVAVGLENGEVDFGWEPTGRYGGIGSRFDSVISVPCVEVNSQLERIIDKSGKIDLLKIDIEMLEKEITNSIRRKLAGKIERIVVEMAFDENKLAETHDISYHRPITCFDRRSRIAKA